MAVPVALIATAAATVGAVSALRAAQRRIEAARLRADTVRAARAAARDRGVLDLEPDEAGTYSLPKAPPPGAGG